MYTVFGSQGQGQVEGPSFNTFDEAFNHIRDNILDMSYSIRLPNGTYHDWSEEEESHLRVLRNLARIELYRDEV